MAAKTIFCHLHPSIPSFLHPPPSNPTRIPALNPSQFIFKASINLIIIHPSDRSSPSIQFQTPSFSAESIKPGPSMKTCRVARKSNGLPEGFRYTSSQGITPLSVLFSFLLLLQAVPFSAADGDGYRGFDDLEVKRAFIIIGVFYFVSVFLCCLFAYYQGCLFSGSAPFSASQQGRRREGLSRSEIESLPTFGFVEVKNLNIGERAPECAVCLAEFTDEATLRLLPKCHHAFHSNCIDGWLTGHSTCPVCRCVLLPVVGGVELTAPPSRSNGDVGGSDRSGDLEANAAENWDRFRLRLPEVMRKKILVEPRSSRPESSNGSEREEGEAAREGVTASQGSCCGGLAGLLISAGEAAATMQDLEYLSFQIV